MRLIFLSILLCFSTPILFAQEGNLNPPDYAIIKTLIDNEESGFHYPKLLERYKQHDTTLAFEEYYLLYYGQVLQEDFKPYKIGADDFKKAAYRKEKDIDLHQLKEMGIQALNDHPFDLRSLLIMIDVSYNAQDTELGDKLKNKLINLLSTIYNSGNGESCETAFHVIDVSDEYIILEYLQLNRKKQSLIGFCDRQEVEKNDRGIKSIYFNVRPILEQFHSNLK